MGDGISLSSTEASYVLLGARLGRKKERARGPRWEREREKRGLGLGQALSIFRLLLFLLGNPAGTYAEERVRILGA